MTTPPPTASRARDAEIAQTVMGLVRCTAEIHDSGAYLPCHAQPESPDKGAETPAYSSTWDGMRLVVERMAAMGWECTMAVGDGAEPWCEFVTGPDRRVIEYAATLPEAVALAALAALRGGDQ